MHYTEYAITDQGYALVDGGTSIPEIWGLENRIVNLGEDETDDQRFCHRGYAGLPDTSGATVHATAMTARSPLLALYVTDAPLSGGRSIARADVAARLAGVYGWAEGTTLDTEGVPVAPIRS